MLRIGRASVHGLKYPLYSSLALSFASLGDAFLYPFLPQYAEVMDVPVVWIGILLSVNRFIRIGFNPVVTRLFRKYGMRQVTIVAVALAVVSTLGYGLGWGIISLLTFRIMWGMAFAVLRLSTLAYAFEHEYVGLSLGISKGIQEAGPLFSLWIGPLLLDHFSITNTFVLLALISLPSALYAMALPDLRYVQHARPRLRISLPSLFNSITFVSAFTVEGVLITAAGLLLAGNNPSLSLLTITSAAAGYLAYRRICTIFLAPLSGAIADKIGLHTVFNLSLLAMIAGLFTITAGWTAAGLIIVFTFSSINSTLAPCGAAIDETDKISALALNAGWRDIGAACGALTGGLLMSGRFVSEILLTATFVLTALLILRSRQNKKI